MAPLVALPMGAVGSEAYGVSLDGSVVVGSIQYKHGYQTAFRWSSQGGLVELGALPGDSASIAYAVSADGSVVVGRSGAHSGEAFRWTQEVGMVGLGSLPGGSRYSCAFAISADGSIVVGQSHGEFGSEAFIWDAAHGMRSIRQLLMSEGNWDASLRKWKLRLATAVSRDGSTIVGYGINPKGDREAWIARLGNLSSNDGPEFRYASR
jgi:probable HAF family extracellular repeat protein